MRDMLITIFDYIAVSLDGYITDRNGSVDWIKGQDDSVEPEDTFTPFFRLG